MFQYIEKPIYRYIENMIFRYMENLIFRNIEKIATTLFQNLLYSSYYPCFRRSKETSPTTGTYPADEPRVTPTFNSKTSSQLSLTLHFSRPRQINRTGLTRFSQLKTRLYSRKLLFVHEIRPLWTPPSICRPPCCKHTHKQALQRLERLSYVTTGLSIVYTPQAIPT